MSNFIQKLNLQPNDVVVRAGKFYQVTQAKQVKFKGKELPKLPKKQASDDTISRSNVLALSKELLERLQEHEEALLQGMLPDGLSVEEEALGRSYQSSAFATLSTNIVHLQRLIQQIERMPRA